MSDLKQVKVDNWGIFFLQKLKNFFNRTDYCDLTLQFQDNTQLKVHRLVLNACTEYFEVLERTCEMYEDCLIMPDDLQTDVMVPIINFMYTGHLEYKTEMLDRLYQTSQIMNITVLTKLLDAQRNQVKESHSIPKYQHGIPKRSYNKAFGTIEIHKNKVYNTAAPKYATSKQMKPDNNSSLKKSISCIPVSNVKKKVDTFGKKPIRYDIPEELDTDNLIDESFTNISYESKPLMVHPDAKRYAAKKPNFGIFTESNSRDDVVEFKKISSHNMDSIFDELASETYNAGSSVYASTNTTTNRNSEQLFNRMLNEGPKVTIDAKHGNSGNLDHAKIISEVLKKYPHLMKSNKNIRLKILNSNTQSKSVKKIIRSDRNASLKDVVKLEPTQTYESEIIDSQEAGRLISLGAYNVKGPWICLICGTPGKALNFTSYYKFRRHLVEIHNEKPISSCCEHCGLKSAKRNYLIHHLYTKHGVEPPPGCHFPKCNMCDYIGLNERFLARHKLQHDTEPKIYRCNSCSKTFRTLQLLLTHIQMTGRKCGKAIKCVYCQKYFLKEVSLYAHFKMCHKNEAKNDGILDNSDEEEKSSKLTQKIESEDDDETEDSNDMQYQIEQQYDGNIQLLTKKVNKVAPTPKILNKNFNSGNTCKLQVRNINNTIVQNEIREADEIELEQSENGTKKSIEIIHNSEFLQKQPFKNEDKLVSEEYIFEETTPSTAIQVPHDTNEFVDTTNYDETKMLIKKPENINQPIQIVVSSEEEYKALMASNPSIIFDESNPNKTLTVLTAPHASTLNATTIDLNNPQSNDMMILPDHFSLNVSEAVSTENSNIVVVYSHPVDGENKQYLVNSVNYAQPQLISSQEIDAQFVSTSAVITQNFETITTSTSIDPEQIIVQQPVEAWQNNMQQDIENQLNNGQHLEMAVNQSEHIMEEVPELSNGQTSAEDELTELPDISTHESQSNVPPNTQNDEIANVGIIMSSSNETAAYIQGEEEGSASPVKISDSVINVIDENCHVETDNNDLETPHVMEVVQETKKDSLQPMLPTKTFVVDEKIKTLASEWSDDEENGKNNNLSEHTNDVVEENVIIVSEENVATDTVNEIQPTEVEESIENIKQEVARQECIVSGLNTSIVNEETHDDTTREDVSHVNKEHISTLINDWDENDSQKTEPLGTEIAKTSIGSDSVEQHKDERADTTPIEVVPDKADDKIKKLVSDWDEDDDDKI